jgi:hypothetical protein
VFITYYNFDDDSAQRGGLHQPVREGQRLARRKKTQEGQPGHQLQGKIEYLTSELALNTAAHVAAANDQL